MAFLKKAKPAAKKGKEEKPKNKKEKQKSNDVVFAKGITVFAPHKNAPDFVMCSIIISIAQFDEWVNENADMLKEHEKYGAQLRLTLKESQGGALYLSVDTYGLDEE